MIKIVQLIKLSPTSQFDQLYDKNRTIDQIVADILAHKACVFIDVRLCFCPFLGAAGVFQPVGVNQGAVSREVKPVSDPSAAVGKPGY